MKRGIFRRLCGLLLAAAAVYGLTFGALALRGLRYVAPDAESWLLLPYIVPAARYEQETSVRYRQGVQAEASLVIRCYDAQGRLCRSIVWDKGGWVPRLTDFTYDGAVRTEWTKGAAAHGWLRVTTDQAGRDTRVELDDGRTAVLSYQADQTEPYRTEWFDPQGSLIEWSLWEREGDTAVYTSGGADRAASTRIVYRYDSRGNLLSAQGGIVGEPPIDKQWSWTYHDAERTAVRHGGGQTVRFCYDAQGRTITESVYAEDGAETYRAESVYREITRQRTE